MQRRQSHISGAFIPVSPLALYIHMIISILCQQKWILIGFLPVRWVICPARRAGGVRALQEKLLEILTLENTFFHSFVFVNTATAVWVYFPHRKKKYSACNSQNGNLQPEWTRPSIVLNTSLWHLIMRILSSVNNMKCTWATCQRDQMSAVE